MRTEWFSHLPNQAEKEQFKKTVLASKIVLDRLQEICYNKIKNGEKTSETDYDSPSWAYLQADRNGFLRAYREILTLLNVSDKET